MQAQPVPEYITTSWGLLWGFFAREQHLLGQVAKLERSLHEAGLQNQNERIAYNSLRDVYDQLCRDHNRLIEMYESLQSYLDHSGVPHVVGLGLSTIHPRNGSFATPSYERGSDSVQDGENVIKIEDC